MPRVLLINPPFNITKAKYDTSLSVGLLSLASYLDKHNIETVIVDALRQRNYLDLIKQQLSKVDIAGLSVMTMQVGSALEISKLIKKEKPEMKIVWGGVHPTLFPEATVKHPLVDVVVFGEGEESLLELIQAQEADCDLEKISGLAFKKNGQIIANKVRPFIDMDDLPLPKWELMPQEILENISLIPTHTSRGCPHQCAFCINSITNNFWRGYGSETVLKGLETIKQKPYFKNKPIRFWDENFFTDIMRAEEIVQGMIDRNLVMPWETTIRVDYIREGMVGDNFLALLKKSGCYLFSFGGESGSEHVLRQINKGTKPEQILYSAQQTLKHNITPQYSFMVGLPNESRQDIKQTIKMIDRLVRLGPRIQILGPQAFRPYPGSKLYDECVRSGWQAPQSLNDWAEAVRDQLNFLSPRNFPWIRDKVDLVESLEAYVRFGAHSFKSAMGSTVKSNRLIKLAFVLLCKLRWKLKFFKWPLEFKLARKVITKT